MKMTQILVPKASNNIVGYWNRICCFILHISNQVISLAYGLWKPTSHSLIVPNETWDLLEVPTTCKVPPELEVINTPMIKNMNICKHPIVCEAPTDFRSHVFWVTIPKEGARFASEFFSDRLAAQQLKHGGGEMGRGSEVTNCEKSP